MRGSPRLQAERLRPAGPSVRVRMLLFRSAPSINPLHDSPFLAGKDIQRSRCAIPPPRSPLSFSRFTQHDDSKTMSDVMSRTLHGEKLFNTTLIQRTAPPPDSPTCFAVATMVLFGR